MADSCPAIRSHADVDAVRAGVERQRLKDVVAVVAQRRRRGEILEDGRLNRLRRSRLAAGDRRERQRRDLMRSAIQVEGVHRNEQVGFAAGPRHLLLVRPVVVLDGHHAADSAAGSARLQTGGAPPCRRIPHRVVVQTASGIWKRGESRMS